MNVFEFPMLFSAFCAANTQAHKSINHLPDAHLWYHWSMMHILYTHPSENCQHTFFFKTIKHLPCDTFHWTKKNSQCLASSSSSLFGLVMRVHWINMKYLRFAKINSTRAHRKWYFSWHLYFPPSYSRFLSSVVGVSIADTVPSYLLMC